MDKKLGVPKSIQNGFVLVHGDVIVTMDADGQHDPSDIPKLIKPLTEGKAEVALGVRDEISDRSERIINLLTNLSVKCSDVGTGFRAIRAGLAKKMRLHGACLCGTFVLEVHKHGARITEIPVQIKSRMYGKRKVRTRHIKQFFHVLTDLIFLRDARARNNDQILNRYCMHAVSIFGSACHLDFGLNLFSPHFSGWFHQSFQFVTYEIVNGVPYDSSSGQIDIDEVIPQTVNRNLSYLPRDQHVHLLL